MSDLKDRLAIFEAKAASSDGGQKPKVAPKSPKASHKHGEKVHKLSPALLKNVNVSLEAGRVLGVGAGGGGGGGGGGAATAGGGGGGRGGSKSPAIPKKKTKSSSHLPAKGASCDSVPPNHADMGKLGVGLLASVTKEMSSSTGALDSFSSSTSSSSKKPRPTPPSKEFKPSSVSPQRSRKAAALSMDASGIHSTSLIDSGSWEKPVRPLSTGTPHRVVPMEPQRAGDDTSPSSLRRSSPVVSSPSGSPLLERRRMASGSLEKVTSPQIFTPHTFSTHLDKAFGPISASRSSDDLLDTHPTETPKPRSNSDHSDAQQSPAKKIKPALPHKKPAVPPKKPGLLTKAAKPPIAQLRHSPQFNRRVVSPEELSRNRSKSATPDLTSPSSDNPPASLDRTEEGLSPSPKPAVSPRHSPAPAGGSETISPPPVTPSPRSNQLEPRGERRNADSGFASETAEDIISDQVMESRGRKEEGAKEEREGEEGRGGEGGERGREGGGEEGGEQESGQKEEEEEVWDEARLEKARNKRFHIAEELLKTEATYVERLQLIAERFHEIVTDFSAQNKQVIPEADINRIFLNIPQIYNLSVNILEELQKRMDTWSTQEGLGDVIARLAPFLKLYAHYTSGFEDAMKLLTYWTKKDKKFDMVVRNFERELATGLGVAHYMLEPVQRIPRYRLLLTDYLKYLPPNSPDRLATEKALGIISEAADHSNDRIKELENSNTILSIQRSLQDYEGSLLSPGRLFIRKGQLQKFSRKTTTPRMFFLFSDMLLHTEPAGTDVFKFKNEMPIFMMKVEEPKVSLVPHSFYVESTTRSLILVASSEAEKNEWISVLRKAIGEERKKRSSLRKEVSMSVITGQFGAQAPIMVPDKSVTMCQVCSAVFTFTFRRHHCRGCGKVVCGNCSQWRAYVAYLKRFERVCEKCNYISKSESGEDVDFPAPSPVAKKEGILDIKAYEEDTIKAGYVLSQEGRKWTRLWYQLKQNFCLYKFRAHEDIKAISSQPLPGYIVTSDRSTFTITLSHPSSKKEFSDVFRLENAEDFDIWALALESVVKLEVPTLPKSRSSSPPDERWRSQSLRDLNAVAEEENNLEKSI